MRYLAALIVAAALAGCSTTPPYEERAPRSQSKGGYYKDDGPDEKPPPNLVEVPDAQPKAEPPHRFANRPYRVFGIDYVPLAQSQPFGQRGVASWYGRRFHGNKTASGEPYDMYAMSAAHPTLPIPSYVRVTHLANRRSVVVRVNDRGPFHSGRIIDLSYAAAFKLGFIQSGSAEVELEAVLPGPSQDASALYIQVGAFSSRDNAETLRARLAHQLGLQETAEVLLTGNLWRLHVGPYRSQQDARSVAERIESELNLKSLVVVR
jgi:peptidoglycan lytic transglycosylase